MKKKQLQNLKIAFKILKVNIYYLFTHAFYDWIYAFHLLISYFLN